MVLDEEVILNIRELDLKKVPPLNDKDFKGGSKIVVIGKPGCFLAGTQIMMYDGTYKAVENIAINDVVMGDDSTARTVLDTANGYQNMWEYKSEHGDVTYTVNDDHIFSLYNRMDTTDSVNITLTDYLVQTDAWKDTYLAYRPNVDFTSIPDISETKEECFSLGQHVRLMGEHPELTDENDAIPTHVQTAPFEKRKYLLSGFIYEAAYRITTRSDYLDKSWFIPCSCPNVRDFIHKLGWSMGAVVIDTDPVQLEILFRYNTQTQELESTLYRFTLTSVGFNTWYGFTLDGNNRFRLGDNTIAHNSGKSTVIKSLLYEKRHIFPVGQVFSGTEDSNHFFGDFFPETFIYNGLSVDDLSPLENFVARQKYAHAELEPHGISPWAINIIDDCGFDKKFMKTKIIQKMYKNGRHFRMMHILSLQDCLDMDRSIRGSVDGVFILKENNTNSRELLYKNFANGIHDFKTFNILMDALTNDYRAMYINNKTTSNNIEDCVFHYKANPDDIPKTWKFGSQEFWDFHYDRYDKESEHKVFDI